MKKFLAVFLIAFLLVTPFVRVVHAEVGDVVEKIALSGSTNGKGIKVVATATPGTTIHTAATGTTGFDEVWIWVVNTHAAAVDLTIEYGGVTDPDLLINKDSIPVEDGLYLVVPGLIIQNGLSIAAFASQANVLVIYGYVNRMTE